MAKLTKLKLSLKTGLETFSGTNAKIYLAFCGRGAGQIYEIPTRPADLEAGKLSIYEAEIPNGPDLAEITGLLLINGMNGSNPGWRVLWVKLAAVDGDGQSWQIADTILERWLETTPGKAPAAFVPLKQPLERMEVQDAVGRPTCTLALVG